MLTLFTYSISRKSGKFYCIMYRTDKITLLLIMATWRFDIIKNCLICLIAFKTSANTVSVNTVLSYSKWSSVFSHLHILSQPISKTRDIFVLRKIFSCFLQCDFYFRNFIWLWMKLSKRIPASLLRHICWKFKFGEVGGHCFIWIICRQFLCRHCWITCAVCAEPDATRQICHFIRQQLVAVFNKLWKQILFKLLQLLFFNYCLQKHYDPKMTSFSTSMQVVVILMR